MDIDDQDDSLTRFFKIILEPRRDLYKLGIPNEFVDQYGNDLLDVVTLTVPTGKIWIVELLKENGRVWFADGWQEFATYYSICHGHFLVFAYQGMSKFNVFIFDLTACEIEYPFDRRETEDSNMVSAAQLIMLNPSSPTSASKEYGMLAFVRQSTQKWGTLNRQNIKQINSLQYENPSFAVQMHSSHVTYDFRCNVPIKFATQYLMKAQRTCTLQNSTGKKWVVQCEGNPAYVRLARGWREYVLDNELQVGDICVFELKNIAKRLFNNGIIRKSSQELGIRAAAPSTPTDFPVEVI